MKNIPIRKRHQLAVKALKNNPKKAQHIMRRNRTGGRCCLCVIQDVAIECGVQMSNSNKGYPTKETKDFFEWNIPNSFIVDPELKVLKDFSMLASVINDSKINVPHSVIAEFYHNTFVRKSGIVLSDRAKVYAARLEKNHNY